MFEYTSGCGAHANRKRPVAPAAPTHNNNVGGAQPMHQPRKPLNVFQQQKHSQHLTSVHHSQPFSGTGGSHSLPKGSDITGQFSSVRMQSSQQRLHQHTSSFSQQQISQSFSQQVLTNLRFIY